MDYIKITEEEAKRIYCRGGKVYISNNKRTYWKLPDSYYYFSNEPAEKLFYKSIPKYEGENNFYTISK